MPANATPETIKTPAELIAGLERLLQVEELDTDLYRGMRNPGGKGRVFGGQVIAQALMSATGSVEPDRIVHSMHAYFMRPGDENLPIICRVERDFDGRSFSTRRVVAMQKGKPILNLAASFQLPEEGFNHQAEMPDVPQPEDLISEAELIARDSADLPEAFVKAMRGPRPIEMRAVQPWSLVNPEKRAPVRQIWMRAVAPIAGDQVMHRAIMTYASDMALLSTSMQPHGVSWISPGMQSASLDHALWLHGDVRADEWMLYVTDSPWAGAGRGFNRGQIFARDGRLIASTAQEGLIRQRRD